MRTAFKLLLLLCALLVVDAVVADEQEDLSRKQSEEKLIIKWCEDGGNGISFSSANKPIAGYSPCGEVELLDEDSTSKKSKTTKKEAKTKSKTSSAGSKKTRIRVKQSPEWSTRTSSKGVEITVSAQVKNTGQYEAKGVDVFLRLRGGEKIKLEGPSSLLPRESASYSGTGQSNRRRTRVNVNATCENCWK